jgi:predicted metal-dependent HD superfamily phosphohydrolase
MSMFGDIARQGMADDLFVKIKEKIKEYPESEEALKELGMEVLEYGYEYGNPPKEYVDFFQNRSEKGLMKERFRNLFVRIGAKGNWRHFYNEIVKAYEAPVYPGQLRFYHTFFGHILFCLKQLDNYPEWIEYRAALEMAIFLHDAIMVVGKTDNEEKSAEFAIELCRQMELPEEFGQKVAKLIVEGTKHDKVPEDNNARIMADIDLSVLSQSPSVYRKLVEEKIEQEFSFAPKEVFRKRRAEILKDFLKRKSIYLTPHFYVYHEKQARRNLKRSIKKLEAKGL